MLGWHRCIECRSNHGIGVGEVAADAGVGARVGLELGEEAVFSEQDNNEWLGAAKVRVMASPSTSVAKMLAPATWP